MMFSPQVQLDAKAHAISEFPKESVGLVSDNSYVPVVNISAHPTEDFKISSEDYLRFKPQAIIHSHIHPKHKLQPTRSDMRGQMDTAIPWGITLAAEESATDILWFGDQTLDDPMIGRKFISGVYDCYSLLRSYYHQRLSVSLPDFARNEEWEDEDATLIEHNFQRVGFVPVDRATAQFNDVLLMSIPAKSPLNHIAILDENGLMLHHLRDKLSRREPWTPSWRLVTKKVIRYVP